MDPARRSRTAPLVVDVDGSLVAGDLLIEGVLRLVAARPLALFALPFWLAAGRAALKRRSEEPFDDGRPLEYPKWWELMPPLPKTGSPRRRNGLTECCGLPMHPHVGGHYDSCPSSKFHGGAS